jgi:hypothetical protein
VAAATAVASALSLSFAAAQTRETPEPVAATLTRLSQYVEQYYSRAQTVVAEERVTLQPLFADMTFNGFPRRLVYELRVEWNPSPSGGPPIATVVRQLISVRGRPPRPVEKSECLDPRAVSPEPLAVLLPGRRDRFTFTSAGEGRVDRRSAVMLDYSPIVPEPPQVIWRDECVSIDLPGYTHGRVWMDPITAEVLRLDERVVGAIQIPVPRARQRRGAAPAMTIERAETSIRYHEVTFTDPDERLLLPAQIDSVTVVRNSGVPRLRTTQTFSNYRRFLTGSRLVH